MYTFIKNNTAIVIVGISCLIILAILFHILFTHAPTHQNTSVQPPIQHILISYKDKKITSTTFQDFANAPAYTMYYLTIDLIIHNETSTLISPNVKDFSFFIGKKEYFPDFISSSKDGNTEIPPQISKGITLSFTIPTASLAFPVILYASNLQIVPSILSIP